MGLALHQKFHPRGLIKFAFQNYVLVHHRHHSIDHLGLRNSGKQQDNYEMEARSHQKVCPILKKKLKCFSTCEEGTAGALRRRNRKCRRIEVIANVKTHRPDRSAVTRPGAHRVRHIIEVAGCRGWIQTETPVGLRKLKDTVGHISGRGKNIPHIMKHHCAQIVADKREWQRRRAQFKVIQEERFATQRKTAGEVAWACLVDAEPAVGSCCRRRRSVQGAEQSQWRRKALPRLCA